jgi:zinc transport system substrate-binding protein
VNYPLAYFAERLGGDLIEVVYPIPADRDPAFWRPGIADIAAYQQADVIALNGAGYADWVAKASLPRAATVDTSAGFAQELIATETITHSHGEDGDHSHTGTANHTWLDFDLAAAQAEALAERMTRRMPELSSAINSNLKDLQANLDELDRRATEVTRDLTDAVFIASHPRYQYFARAYGLTIESLEWEAAAAPTEDQLVALDALMSETGASLFIWEAEPPAEARAAVAERGLTDIVFPTGARKPEETDFILQMNAVLDELDALS